MIGYCEAEDADSPDKEIDLYSIPSETNPNLTILIWLCQEHRP
jgi:hypothetical protein